MKKSELLAKIEALEKRVSELEPKRPPLKTESAPGCYPPGFHPLNVTYTLDEYGTVTTEVVDALKNQLIATIREAYQPGRHPVARWWLKLEEAK